MPDFGALLAGLLDFIGEQIGASSLRLGPIPTVALLGIVLVLLSLIARPTTRGWPAISGGWRRRPRDGPGRGVGRRRLLAGERGRGRAHRLPIACRRWLPSPCSDMSPGPPPAPGCRCG